MLSAPSSVNSFTIGLNKGGFGQEEKNKMMFGGFIRTQAPAHFA
jgi:hypothetical protein